MPNSPQNCSAESEHALDAARYRRLRVLGCAPYGTKHLQKGEVMRFTNLDECVDADIKWTPSRGERPSEAKNADANAIHIKVIDVIYGNSSLNMTPEACSEQAHRVASALIAKGLIRDPARVSAMRDALESAQKIIERDYPNGQLAIDIRNALAVQPPIPGVVKKPAGCEPCSWPECGCQYSPAPVVMPTDAQSVGLAARLRQSADHDGPQELKMVMRRVATALERASQPSPAATVVSDTELQALRESSVQAAKTCNSYLERALKAEEDLAALMQAPTKEEIKLYERVAALEKEAAAAHAEVVQTQDELGALLHSAEAKLAAHPGSSAGTEGVAALGVQEVADAWGILESHGFPPEAVNWPEENIAGKLPVAIDNALTAIVGARDDLLAEVIRLRAEPQTSDMTEAMYEITNRAANFMDADAAEWMPSIYKIACEAIGRDPWPMLEANGWKRDQLTVSVTRPAPQAVTYCTPDGPANCEAWAVDKRCPTCPVTRPHGGGK